MGPKDTGPFRHGEKVLVPHTDKHYPAKVMKSEKREEGLWYYMIHYQGWNKQWDEWVEAPGLKRWDPKLVEANEEKEADGPEKKRKSLGSKKPGEKRRKAADIVPQDVELPGETGEPAIELRLPADLKQLLLDEHAAVVGGRHLPPLPRAPSVVAILQKYVEESRQSRQIVDAEEQVSNGLRVYFDKALRQSLLYDHERAECDEALERGVIPSCLYGAEHLLRLCAKLPHLVPLTGASPEAYQTLQEQLAMFVAFLSRRKADFFTPAAEYVSQ